MRIPDPIEELVACHGRIRLRLETISQLLSRLPAEPPAEELEAVLTDLLAFFDSSVVRHTRDEEEIVFPVLRQKLDAGLLTRLQAEHVNHEGLLARCREAAERVRAEDRRSHREALRETFRALRDDYLQHMEAEEKDLFPHAALSAEERERLGKALLESRAFRLQVKGKS
ncbi:MAG: hemerythrin domain-containing protein [Candidatus Xenobia bacterium]